MKLKATFTKQANGLIAYEIYAQDAQDFVTTNIFTTYFDPDVGHTLDLDSEDATNRLFGHHHSEEVVDLVDNIVAEIKKKLDSWRTINVPVNREYEI